MAYLLAHPWTDPITINSKGDMVDGLHRLKAAVFRGDESILVEIVQAD